MYPDNRTQSKPVVPMVPWPELGFHLRCAQLCRIQTFAHAVGRGGRDHAEASPIPRAIDNNPGWDQSALAVAMDVEFPPRSSKVVDRLEREKSPDRVTPLDRVAGGTGCGSDRRAPGVSDAVIRRTGSSRRACDGTERTTLIITDDFADQTVKPRPSNAGIGRILRTSFA